MDPRLLCIAFLCSAQLFITSCNDSGFAGQSEKEAPQPVVQKKSDPSLKRSPAKREPAEPRDEANFETQGGRDIDDVADGIEGLGERDPLPDDSLADAIQPQEPDFDSVIDTFSGLIDEGDEIGITDDDKEVTFGESELFHVGDAAFHASSCRFEVNSYSLSGTQYYFNFEILKDGTTVDIRINKICGVDYGDTNVMTLAREGGGTVHQQSLRSYALSATLPRQQLNRGRYTLIVESRNGSTDPKFPDIIVTDHDDFIIGDINIRADKEIAPGDFGAR